MQVALASGPLPVNASVVRLLEEERGSGLSDAAYYRGFAREVAALGHKLHQLLSDLKRRGATIVAYGASAKGSTLLNHFGIGRDVLDYIVDRSTVKQGRYTPGTHLPIYSPERLLADAPDYVLLLTWNFADEIMQQQREYRRRGGQFIVPLPQPVVVAADGLEPALR